MTGRTAWWMGVLVACAGGDGDPGTERPVPDAPWQAPAAPESCDAGDEAWVQRAMPLIWGRKPHGAAEVRSWAQMAREHGRDAVVRAMSIDIEYVRHWREWFTDTLFVARVGDKSNAACFEDTRLTLYGGGLAAHIADMEPTERFSTRFTMGDVLLDSLYADNLAPIYRAHLFARMSSPVQGANVSEEELEYNRRISFGELFFQTYLGRDLECMACHNSSFSVTDDRDPALDHTWQLPGRFEFALFESDVGLPSSEIFSVFRHADVVRPPGAGMRPWGMAGVCGSFANPSQIPRTDFLGHDASMFVTDLGPSGSVHDVQRVFAEGVAELRGDGLTVADDNSVSGPSAFAYLVAANVANHVWEAGTGTPLTIAHYFPRTEAQQVRLQALADTFASSGFSLRELLVAVTADPYFNAGLRSSCRAQEYGLAPVFNPFSDSEEREERRRNSAGDAAHRMGARELLNTTHRNLGWDPRPSWFGGMGDADNPEAVIQESLGVFLRESSPGSVGSDLQGLLAWESEYGHCRWADSSDDVVSQIVDRAVAEQGTVEELAHAIKDRLTSQALDEEERPLVGDLFGAAPGSVVTDAEAVLPLARLYCGAVLLSPQLQLVSDAPVGWAPRLAVGVEEDCARVALRMTGAGVPVTCQDGRLVSGGGQ